MTIRDLVLLAGGLKESAYLKEAEIARLPRTDPVATTAITIVFRLDSTFLFERKADEAYVGAPACRPRRGVLRSARSSPTTTSW